jgi:hypothetical protein
MSATRASNEPLGVPADDEYPFLAPATPPTPATRPLGGEYVVGPGPIAIRNFLGRLCGDSLGKGNFAVAVDDQHGPRRVDARSFFSREAAERIANYPLS